MPSPRKLASPLLILAALSIGAFSIGCEPAPGPKPSAQPYLDLGYKKGIPDFLKGTVYERTDLGNNLPYPVTGYSIVVNLQNTGNNDAGIPTAVRSALIKRMAYSGFGMHNDPRFTALQPEQALADRRVAIVQVIGLLPVGARRGQRFDLDVRAMPNSRTTSLAHGRLYNTELRNRGLEQPTSGGTILAYADAGDIFVNPVYALNGPNAIYPGISTAQLTASLRHGTVLNAGKVTEDRPIFIQLRVPEAKIARAIERRINTRFPPTENDRIPAAAQDEGLVYVYLPYSFNGDWQHFTEVINHLYLNDTPDYTARKVHDLIAAIYASDAPLTDISYCLEGMGPAAVPLYQGLIDNSNPAIAYAAARAAVFNSDDHALRALISTAIQPGHPFQLAAVNTLGQLPQSNQIDRQIETLLGSDQTLVRIEAYKMLSAHNDRRIITEDLPTGFRLDIVDCSGPPLVFATQSGQPRLAVFGKTSSLAAPVVYSAMNDRLTISTDDAGQNATLFYRDQRDSHAVHVLSGLTIAEIISRLGGRGPAGQPALTLNYTESVAVMQGLAQLHALGDSTGHIPAPFMLEQPTSLTDALVNSALGARPQADPLRAKPAPGAGLAEPADNPALLAGPSQAPAQPPATNDKPNNPGASPSNSVPDFGNP